MAPGDDDDGPRQSGGVVLNEEKGVCLLLLVQIDLSLSEDQDKSGDKRENEPERSCRTVQGGRRPLPATPAASEVQTELGKLANSSMKKL